MFSALLLVVILGYKMLYQIAGLQEMFDSKVGQCFDRLSYRRL